MASVVRSPRGRGVALVRGAGAVLAGEYDGWGVLLGRGTGRARAQVGGSVSWCETGRAARGNGCIWGGGGGLAVPAGCSWQLPCRRGCRGRCAPAVSFRVAWIRRRRACGVDRTEATRRWRARLPLAYQDLRGNKVNSRLELDGAVNSMH